MISEYGPSLDLGEVWGKYALLQLRCIKRERKTLNFFSARMIWRLYSPSCLQKQWGRAGKRARMLTCSFSWFTLSWRSLFTSLSFCSTSIMRSSIIFRSCSWPPWKATRESVNDELLSFTSLLPFTLCVRKKLAIHAWVHFKESTKLINSSWKQNFMATFKGHSQL